MQSSSGTVHCGKTNQKRRASSLSPEDVNDQRELNQIRSYPASGWDFRSRVFFVVLKKKSGEDNRNDLNCIKERKNGFSLICFLFRKSIEID